MAAAGICCALLRALLTLDCPVSTDAVSPGPGIATISGVPPEIAAGAGSGVPSEAAPAANSPAANAAGAAIPIFGVVNPLLMTILLWVVYSSIHKERHRSLRGVVRECDDGNVKVVTWDDRR